MGLGCSLNHEMRMLSRLLDVGLMEVFGEAK